MQEAPDPQAAEAKAAPSSPAPAPKRALWRQGPGLLPSILALPVLGGALACGLWWGLATEAGSTWLLHQVPGLQVRGLQGSLMGDLSVQQLSYVLPGTQDKLELQDLSWRGLSLRWNRSPHLWADLQIEQLQLRRLHLHLAPSPEPVTAPQDLRLPIGLQITKLQVQELVIPSLSEQALHDLQASLQLSAQGGAEHQLQLDRVQWDLLQLSGKARIQTAGSMALQSQLTLHSKAQREDHLPAWQAQLQAQGPLQSFGLKADMQAESQALQAQAQVQPFAAWPLPTLQLNTQTLDLSALISGMPRTRLTGQAQLQAHNSHTAPQQGEPRLDIKSQLSNSLAGRWNEQLLPVRELQLDLSFAPGDPAALIIRQLDLLLGSAQLPAGRVQAKGQSSKTQGSALTIAIRDLNSEALDARAAALQLAGEIELSTAESVNHLNAERLPSAHLNLQAKLEGRLQSLGQPLAGKPAKPSAGLPHSAPLSLTAQAQLSATELLLHKLKLSFDEAALDASAHLTLKQAASLAQGWRAQAKLQAQVPDLRRLWRGNEGSPWQDKVQALAAQLDADLEAGPLPSGSKTRPQDLYAYAPQGTAQLQLIPTQLAGVPWSGELRYTHLERNQAPKLSGQLNAGAENRLQALGELSPAGEMHAQANVQFSDLAALQPLLNAFNAKTTKARPQAQLQGSVQGEIKLQAGLLGAAEDGQSRTSGAANKPAAKTTTKAETKTATKAGSPWTATDWRWHSTAELQARRLQWSGSAGRQGLSLASGDLQWDLDSAHEAPLVLRAGLAQLSGKDWQLPNAKLEGRGSWAQHRISLQALAEGKLPSALIPPGQPAEQMLRGPLNLSLNGGLSVAPPVAWRDGAIWQASDIQLLAQAQAPAAPGEPSAQPWLKADKLKLALELAPQAQPKQLRVEPGRLELLGAGLSWQDMQWASAGAKATGARGPSDDYRLDLRLEPVAVAPLLARWQPDFGWSGNLQMVGHVQVHSAPQLHVDVALERSAGDLAVSDDRGTQKLELSEFRLGLIGSPGVWHLTHALAGNNVGVLGAALTTRNDDPAQWWPSVDARLEGVLEARVANLSTWGAWVPAGWRMGGSVFTSASLGGRLKAPEIKGRAGGSGLVLRNPLMGVDLQRGEFALSLDGGQAKLEQFKAYAGEGDVSAQGELQFGAKPRADLHVRADKFALLRRVDQRLAVNGRVDLALDAELLDVQGKLDVHEGLFDFSRGNAPELSDDVSVRRPQADKQEAEAKAAAANKTRAKLRVKVDIDLGKKLRVKGYGLDTLLAGQLQLTQAANGPALHGRINTESGSFDAYGQKLAIEKGIISFSGVVDNPRLDVLALRPSQEEQRVGVTITGTAQKPRVKLYSEPALDERSTLSWLLLGRAPSELGSQDNALLSSAALALLSGQGESTSSKIIKSVGLDELSFSDSGVETQGTVVRLGKQLSKNWYVGYERGLNATTGSWQLVYRLAQRFTLRAQSGDDNALDLIWQWKWE